MSGPALRIVERDNVDKGKALEAALGQIERSFGKGSIMRLGQRDSAVETEVVSTGSLGLDIALGIGGTMLLQSVAGWQMAISPMSVGLAFGFAAGVGVFFGLWPARRAAMLSPIPPVRVSS